MMVLQAIICVSVSCLVLPVCFFFKQKTAYEMRISDWSSDVCSSDLAGIEQAEDDEGADGEEGGQLDQRLEGDGQHHAAMLLGRLHMAHAEQIGRASCRERVCQYV